MQPSPSPLQRRVAAQVEMRFHVVMMRTDLDSCTRAGEQAGQEQQRKQSALPSRPAGRPARLPGTTVLPRGRRALQRHAMPRHAVPLGSRSPPVIHPSRYPSASACSASE